MPRQISPQALSNLTEIDTMLAINWNDPRGIAIMCVLFLVVVGILIVVAKRAGWQPPPWFWEIAGLVALGIVGIAAIIFLFSFA